MSDYRGEGEQVARDRVTLLVFNLAERGVRQAMQKAVIDAGQLDPNQRLTERDLEGATRRVVNKAVADGFTQRNGLLISAAGITDTVGRGVGVGVYEHNAVMVNYFLHQPVFEHRPGEIEDLVVRMGRLSMSWLGGETLMEYCIWIMEGELERLKVWEDEGGNVGILLKKTIERGDLPPYGPGEEIGLEFAAYVSYLNSGEWRQFFEALNQFMQGRLRLSSGQPAVAALADGLWPQVGG